MSRNSPSSQDYDGGPSRVKPRNPVRMVEVAPHVSLNWERFTPPCADCNLPLVKSDRCCPRCGLECS